MIPGPAPLCFARVHGCFECLSASRSDETVCLGAWTPPPPPPPTVIFISVQEEDTVQSQLAACCAESLPALTSVSTNVLTCLSDGVHDVETVVAWKHWSVKSEARASS